MHVGLLTLGDHLPDPATGVRISQRRFRSYGEQSVHLILAVIDSVDRGLCELSGRNLSAYQQIVRAAHGQLHQISQTLTP